MITKIKHTIFTPKPVSKVLGKVTKAVKDLRRAALRHQAQAEHHDEEQRLHNIAAANATFEAQRADRVAGKIEELLS